MSKAPDTAYGILHASETAVFDVAMFNELRQGFIRQEPTYKEALVRIAELEERLHEAEARFSLLTVESTPGEPTWTNGPLKIPGWYLEWKKGRESRLVWVTPSALRDRNAALKNTSPFHLTASEAKLFWYAGPVLTRPADGPTTRSLVGSTPCMDASARETDALPF